MLLREDENRRGRAPGEVPALLREGLLEAGFPADRILPEAPVEGTAVERAFELARPGDLVAIFAEHPERCWQQVQDLAASATVRVEATQPVESLSLAL